MHTFWKRWTAVLLVIIILGTSYIWSAPLLAQKSVEISSETGKEESENEESETEKPEDSIKEETPMLHAGAVVQGLLKYHRPDYSWLEIRAYVM